MAVAAALLALTQFTSRKRFCVPKSDSNVEIADHLAIVRLSVANDKSRVGCQFVIFLTFLWLVRKGKTLLGTVSVHMYRKVVRKPKKCLFFMYYSSIKEFYITF